MLVANAQNGDVASVRADALITAISSSGMWFGGIDRAIQRVAGSMFHTQALRGMPLFDGDVVYAATPSRAR